MTSPDYSIGIDLGGTNVKIAALDSAGSLLQQRTCPTGNFAAWSVQIRAMVAEIETAQNAPAMGIGVCSPGIIAADGLSVATTAGKMPGLDGLNWTDFLSRPRPVPLLNDAHAALLGESWRGAATGFDHVILLTLGTGVGGAVISDGRLLRGWRRLAGHLGHVCLNVHGEKNFMRVPGSLEGEIGDSTLLQRSHGRFRATRDLVAAAENGDSDARAIWLKSIHALACAIASFINVFDPQAVVIGGGIAQAGKALFGPLRAELEELEFHPDERRVQILPATLGEWAGAYGAARNALAAG